MARAISNNHRMKVTIDVSPDLEKALSEARWPFECVSLRDKITTILLRWSSETGSARCTSREHPQISGSSSTLYVSAPIADLVKGLLHGHEKVETALAHGNFGLGTLHMLDGEVVVLDGTAYQQTPEGTCHVVPPGTLSPFMMVTTFDAERALCVDLPAGTAEESSDAPIDLEGLQAFLLDHVSTKNVFWAIKIEGLFSHVKVRAVRKQSEDRPLIDVTKEQAVMEFSGQRGTLVGFYSPEFLGHQLSVPGFHLHFISETRSFGGHCLALRIGGEAKAWLQDLHEMVQEFPGTREFENADFVSGATEAEKQLKQAEG
jgi:acetolactate decarboxylase